MQQTSDGGYIVAGTIGGGAGEEDLYLIKLGGLPTASFSVEPSRGAAPLEVRVDGSASVAPEGATITRYAFDFGDGAAAEEAAASHTYDAPGRHRITLVVTDDQGREASTTRSVVVLRPSADIAPWSSSDVGEPAFPGSARLEGEERCLHVCAGGRNISGTSDEFHFAYQEVTGDVTITARVSELAGGERPKLGVMLREGLEPGARHAVLLIDGNQSRFRFLRREQTGARIRVSSGETAELPDAWVRIRREGNEFIGLGSPDGARWTEVGRVTLDFPDRVLAGVAATGRDSKPDEPFEPLVARVCELEVLRPTRSFLRGDCNLDGNVDLSDAVCALDWLFAGEGAPGCVAAANTNGDDAVNITDPTHLLLHLFGGGPAPAQPFPDCGPGGLPADVELGCVNPPNC